MIAGQEVDHAVKVVSREQNPRFVLEKSHLTPAQIAARSTAAAAAEGGLR